MLKKTSEKRRKRVNKQDKTRQNKKLKKNVVLPEVPREVPRKGGDGDATYQVDTCRHGRQLEDKQSHLNSSKGRCPESLMTRRGSTKTKVYTRDDNKMTRR